jgi:hypothetical protein
MTADMPTMMNTNYQYSTFTSDGTTIDTHPMLLMARRNNIHDRAYRGDDLPEEETQIEKGEPIMADPKRRIVQVFIADSDANVPLEQSLLYKGEQKLTDATDQELFYEVPIVEILKAHNEKRIKMADKEASKRAGKDIMLEPAKIRDLKMIITNIAQF